MTPRSFCELTCLSTVVFNLTCNWHSFLDPFTGSEHRFGLLQSLNDYTMNIHIDGVPINQSNQSKSLGLIIDENLSWKADIHEISNKLSSGIGALKRVRPFTLFQCTLQLKYTKVLSSHTSIIAALYGMAWETSKLQNRAIRVITKSSLVGTIYRLGGLNKRLI